LKPWPIFRGPSLGLERFKRWFVCAPAIPGLLTASSSSSKSSSAYAPVLSSRPPRRPRRPPSVQSPFAQLGCYLRWGDVVRLLGEHYPSFFARTGSFAAPVGLSPSSAFGLVGESLQVVTSPCCPRQLPDVIRESVLGCWTPYPGGTPCALTCFFHDVIGLPHGRIGSASRFDPANDFSQGMLSRLQ